MADSAFSGLTAATNLAKTDLLGISQDAGGGAFTSKNIQAQHVAKAPEQEGSVTDPALLIANGTIQTLTLGANGTLSTDLASGQSLTALIPATSYTLNTSAFTVVNTFTLSATNLNVLVLFKVGSTSYLVGINK